MTINEHECTVEINTGAAITSSVLSLKIRMFIGKPVDVLLVELYFLHIYIYYLKKNCIASFQRSYTFLVLV